MTEVATLNIAPVETIIDWGVIAEHNTLQVAAKTAVANYISTMSLAGKNGYSVTWHSAPGPMRHSRVWVGMMQHGNEPKASGGVLLTGGNDSGPDVQIPIQRFTRHEWWAFVEGAKAHEFDVPVTSTLDQLAEFVRTGIVPPLPSDAPPPPEARILS